MEKVKEKDFVEVEFTGSSNDQIFDTTDKEDAKKIGLNADVKPIIVSVGNQMLLKGFDDSLAGKEIGKEYTIILGPEQAFGKRDPKLIRIIPSSVFKEKDMNPIPGMTIQLDQNLAKILSVSGGRVTVDFNNPLAGKDVEYKFKITKKIEDDNDKINALQDFFFHQRFTFNIKDKKIIFKDDKIKPLIDLIKPKFKEIIGFDIEFEEKKEKREDKKEEKTKEKEAEENIINDESDKNKQKSEET